MYKMSIAFADEEDTSYTFEAHVAQTEKELLDIIEEYSSKYDRVTNSKIEKLEGTLVATTFHTRI